MINHVRTLIVNLPYASPQLYWGEEVIDREFVPRDWGSLSYLHTLLFGEGSQREYVNYRAWQLLKLAHNSRDAELFTLSDPRITYLPWRTQYADGPFGTQVQTISGTSELIVADKLCEQSGRRGKLRWEWQLEVTAAGQLQIDWENQTQTVAITGTDVSDPLQLPDSQITVRVNLPETVGDKWQLTAYCRPPQDLAETVLSFLRQVASPSHLIWHSPLAEVNNLYERFRSRKTPADQLAIAMVSLADHLWRLPT